MQSKLKHEHVTALGKKNLRASCRKGKLEFKGFFKSCFCYLNWCFIWLVSTHSLSTATDAEVLDDGNPRDMAPSRALQEKKAKAQLHIELSSQTGCFCTM